MATTNYYPNSTNCGGNHGTPTALPHGSRTLTGEVAFTGTENNTTSTSNNSRVQTSHAPGDRAGQRYRFRIVETVADISRLDFSAEGSAGDTNTNYYLYIWNGTAYALLGSRSGAEGTITANITASISSYIDVNADLDLLVQNTTGQDTTSFVSTDYMNVLVTYTSAKPHSRSCIIG